VWTELRQQLALEDEVEVVQRNTLRWYTWTLFDTSQISKANQTDRETNLYKRNTHSTQRMLELWRKKTVSRRWYFDPSSLRNECPLQSNSSQYESTVWHKI